MDAMISDLVRLFEAGKLSRRDLVRGLALMATAASPAAAQTADGLKAVGVDHVSIQTSNLERSVAFYEKVFGLKVLRENKDNQLKLLGAEKFFLSLHQKAPFGVVDHFQLSVANFEKDAVAAKLSALGIAPQENFDYGFHIRDPEGVPVQMGIVR